MNAYYNEFKPEAAHMLRQLIKDGIIAAGDVDDRSITEVKADEIRKYTQCHFFAGIGGWSIALKLAGWPDDRPVWTGSCPCQPFSQAGKREGQNDARHLWPIWFKLISSIKPPIIFGEQVAGSITYGWLDETFNDLETQGYETGAAVLPACSVGAPHKRDRLWFVADSKGRERREPKTGHRREMPPGGSAKSYEAADWISESGVCGLVDALPGRAHLLHAYGNAIVPEVGAEFIKACIN